MLFSKWCPAPVPYQNYISFNAMLRIWISTCETKKTSKMQEKSVFEIFIKNIFLGVLNLDLLILSFHNKGNKKNMEMEAEHNFLN